MRLFCAKANIYIYLREETVWLVEMAKLVLLLVFVCFQFSSQEGLGKPDIEIGKPEIELVKPEIELEKPGTQLEKSEVEVGKPGDELEKPENELVQPEKDGQLLDGADKKKFDEEWTEEDEKWLQEIQQLLQGSDEDDDDSFDSLDSEEFDKLMEELDKYFEESDEDDSDEWWKDDSDEWWKDDDDWDIDFNHYPDYIENQKPVNVVNQFLQLYYAWLDKVKSPNANGRKQPHKRFTSV